MGLTADMLSGCSPGHFSEGGVLLVGFGANLVNLYALKMMFNQGIICERIWAQVTQGFANE